jgi:hypothetical protein
MNEDVGLDPATGAYLGWLLSDFHLLDPASLEAAIHLGSKGMPAAGALCAASHLRTLGAAIYELKLRRGMPAIATFHALRELGIVDIRPAEEWADLSTMEGAAAAIAKRSLFLIARKGIEVLERTGDDEAIRSGEFEPEGEVPWPCAALAGAKTMTLDLASPDLVPNAGAAAGVLLLLCSLSRLPGRDGNPVFEQTAYVEAGRDWIMAPGALADNIDAAGKWEPDDRFAGPEHGPLERAAWKGMAAFGLLEHLPESVVRPISESLGIPSHEFEPGFSGSAKFHFYGMLCEIAIGASEAAGDAKDMADVSAALCGLALHPVVDPFGTRGGDHELSIKFIQRFAQASGAERDMTGAIVHAVALLRDVAVELGECVLARQALKSSAAAGAGAYCMERMGEFGEAGTMAAPALAGAIEILTQFALKASNGFASEPTRAPETISRADARKALLAGIARKA